MSKIQQFVSVVAYVHNNTDQIEKFVTTVMNQCEKFITCEIIFVDDFSTDNSTNNIRQYYTTHKVDYIVTIIRLGKYHGLEIAMNAGRDMAIGDYVFEFDDLYVDYDGNTIMDAYEKCLEGNDIVTVSTDVPIKLTSKYFYRVFNKAIDSNSQIGQESFRLLSRRGINRISSMGIDIPYRKVIYMNSGLSTGEVKYQSTTGDRPARISEKTERIDLAIDSFIYFTKVIQRLSLIVALIFGLISLGTIIYTLVSRGMGYHVGMGWVSTMLFLSIGFSGLFGFLAIIIRYLSLIVNLVFKRQKYLISDIEKIASK